jgi:hypothetical protein
VAVVSIVGLVDDFWVLINYAEEYDKHQEDPNGQQWSDNAIYKGEDRTRICSNLYIVVPTCYRTVYDTAQPRQRGQLALHPLNLNLLSNSLAR